MGSSLQEGLARLQRETDIDRVLISLVDLPGLTVAAVQRVMNSPSQISVAGYGGQRGHPVLLHRDHWAGVRQSAQGDKGARDYLAAHADAITVVDVSDVATGEDLDTLPE
jgi:nicotine blue oxidoreductase